MQCAGKEKIITVQIRVLAPQINRVSSLLGDIKLYRSLSFPLGQHVT
jgi:hypothetical protein